MLCLLFIVILLYPVQHRI